MSVEALRSAIQRYRDAKPEMRRPMLDSAEQLCIVVAKERDEAVRLLDKRWTWLESHHDHPDYEDREVAWLELLCQYEAMEKALAEAAETLYGKVS